MIRKNLTTRYLLAALLFAVAVLYQALLIAEVMRDFQVSLPFFEPQTANGGHLVASPEAVAAGIHPGDTILTINGRPYTGTAVLGEEVTRTHPGQTLSVTLRSAGAGQAEYTVLLHATPKRRQWQGLALELLLHIAVPIVCLLLGIWAVLARPSDRLAWILLLVMLTFPHVLEIYGIERWGPGIREVAMLYHTVLQALFPLSMFLFGYYFPEPFPPENGLRRIWNIMFWVGVMPITLSSVADIVVAMGALNNYAAVESLENTMLRFNGVAQILSYAIVGSFFAAMGAKLNLFSTDARRRIRLIYWGSTVAFTPALIVTLASSVRKLPALDLFPQWVVIAALSLLALFPLVLAYAIVVQRAMDVRVAVRQGLQYALARNGIRVLQVLAVGVVVAAGLSINNGSAATKAEKAIAAAAAIAAVLLIRRFGDRLRDWTDRRFFREAYDTDRVLSDLSDQVRSMVEPRPLIQLVAERLSQTLHVPRVAVLLSADGTFQPAFATGFPSIPNVSFPSASPAMRLLATEPEPARVYLDDQDSWINREPGISNDDRRRVAQLQSELLLPLNARGQLLGFISLGQKLSQEPYSGTDVRLLKSVAVQTGLALENAQLMKTIAVEVAHRERLNAEVEIAREVQERLFPQKLPPIAGVEFAGACRPALGVGGDYYDFLALPAGQLGLAIGDVSGKGIAAALMMASLQASLRGEASRAPDNLAGLMSNVNRLVYEASSSNRYATFFYAQYNPANQQLSYVNAGHNPPLLLRALPARPAHSQPAWSVTHLESGGTVVGLIEDAAYQQGSVTLASGDILVGFTDGISEAMNPDDNEWGEAAMIQSVQRCSNFPSADIIQRVMLDADAFVNGAKQHDDMTLIVLRVR